MAGWRRPALVRCTLPSVDVLLTAMLLAVPIGLIGLSEGTAVGAAPTPIAPGPASTCTGAGAPVNFTGSLSVDGGGSSPPAVANRTIALSYWVDLNYTPKSGSSIFSCLAERATAVTDALGGFTVSAPVPATTCNSVACSIYSGPLGPVGFSVPAGLPPGFFLSQSVTGSQAGLAFVSALTTTRLVPGARVTLSVNAPTVVRAFPTAGNGAPSPASVGFAWELSGAGWSLVNGSGTGNLTIEALGAVAPGTLTEWTNGSYNGTALAAPSVTLDLAAAVTTATGGSAVPTSLDVGFPTTFTVTGQGAGGYVYNVVIAPGLGALDAIAACSTSVVAGGLVALSCSTSVTYGRSGNALPTANLTNGYSTAPQALPSITVAPSPGLTVTPSNALGYAGTAIPVTVAVDPASGTAPRGPACLWSGNGRSLCDPGPGPSYAFSIAYGSPGNYSGKATIADGAGANVSVPFDAAIFARPALPPLVASSNSLEAGQSASIVGSLTGGALPARFWWNSTSPSGTLYGGTLTADGPIVLNFTPRISGLTTIKLTVVDALGSSVFQPTDINVSAGPASAVRASVGGNGAIVAGSSTPVTWSAVNSVGEVVPTFSQPVLLRPSTVIPSNWSPPGGGAPPLQVSLAGTVLPPDANHDYPIAASAWTSGSLRLDITVDGAALLWLQLEGSLPLVGGLAFGTPLVVGPDSAHPVLSRPSVAVAGLRTNQTLWQIADEFGDSLAGGAIRIETTANGAMSTVDSPILVPAPRSSEVWVNYSVPDGVAATVLVLSESGTSLLPSIQVPGPSNGSPLPLADLLIALGLALAVASAVGYWSRTRRPGPSDRGGPDEGPASEADLERWAEGRAHLLKRASTEQGMTLDELARGFVGRPPRPDEMTDWVAALVADGSFRTVLGDDGRSRFLKVHGEEMGPVQVRLDDRALQEALDRRAALEGDEPDDGAP